MWKLIKMDAYRLFSSKTAKVGAIMACLVCFANMLMLFGLVELAKFANQTDPMTTVGWEVVIPQVSWMYGVDFADIIFSGVGGFSLFVGCMVSASFIGSEMSAGYTKNYAGQLPDKGYIAISKFVVTSLAQILIVLIYVVISAVCGLLFFGQHITGCDIPALLLSVSLRVLLYLALNAVIIFICTLTKSHAVAMVVGCIFGLGITKLVYIAAGMLLGTVNIKFPVSDYMPDGIDSQLTVVSAPTLVVKTLVVSLLFIGVAIVANYIVLRKRDVR